MPELSRRTPRSRWTAVLQSLPEGRAIPQKDWDLRHRFVLGFIFIHAVGLAILGLAMGWGPVYSLGEGALLAVLGGVAMIPRASRAFRSTVAALACVMSSAIFTQFIGGYIEGHFHYFVVVALIAMYQDWIPFLLAIVFVALNHGIIGSVMPTWVYNHPSAIAHPWSWGALHAALILAQCAVLVALWKTNELSRARTDLVLESAGEGIIGVDPGRRITFANPAAAEMFGQPLETLHGADLDTVLARAGADTPQSGDAVRTIASGDVAQGTLMLEREAGPRALDWTRSEIIDRGQRTGMVLTLRDASMRLEAEHAKKMQQREEIERLKEHERMKALFINTAAHELHTPLTPLRLNVYALKKRHKDSLTAQQQGIVEILDRNVERLVTLVDDVLNVARLQTDRLKLEKQEIDMADLVDQTATSFAESARAKGITLEVHTDEALPVHGDPLRLTQVLYNLLHNAIKFTPSSGRIRIEATQHEGAALVKIHDDGIGLRQKDIDRLFQPFTQAEPPKDKVRTGSGLGLYISRGIIELHGGQITCHSQGLGQGTTFEVTLPLSDGDRPVHAEGRATAAASIPARSTR